MSDNLTRGCIISDTISDAHDRIMWMIAYKTGAAENRLQRAFGEHWTEAYQADWNVVTETYDMLFNFTRTP